MQESIHQLASGSNGLRATSPRHLIALKRGGHCCISYFPDGCANSTICCNRNELGDAFLIHMQMDRFQRAMCLPGSLE